MTIWTPVMTEGAATLTMGIFASLSVLAFVATKLTEMGIFRR